MKNLLKLTILILLVFGTTSFAGNSPWTKVWVKVKHFDSFEFNGVVLVELEKNTIDCTPNVCPNEDLTVIGEGYDVRGDYMGLHVVKIKKGYLNNEKHWSYDRPKTKPKRANNLWIWEI